MFRGFPPEMVGTYLAVEKRLNVECSMAQWLVFQERLESVKAGAAATASGAVAMVPISQSDQLGVE